MRASRMGGVLRGISCWGVASLGSFLPLYERSPRPEVSKDDVEELRTTVIQTVKKERLC